MIRFVIALLATLCALSTPTSAQESATTPSEAVTVPFNPGTNTERRYRITNWNERDGIREEKGAIEQILRYDLSVQPARLTISTEAAFDTKGIRFSSPAAKLALDDLGRLEFEIDESGYPTRLLEWDRLRAMLKSRLPLMAKAMEPDPAKRESAAKFFANFLSRYDALSDSEAFPVVSKHWPAVLGIGGVTMMPGEAYEERGDADLLVGAGSTAQTSRTTMTIPDKQTIRLSTRTVSETGQLGAALDTMTKDLGAPSQETRITKQMNDLGPMVETIIADYDSQTGIVKRVEFARTLGPLRQMTTIETVAG